MSIAQSETTGNSDSSDFPRTWRWDQDGESLTGTFVEFDEGPTAYGAKPILVIEIEGERRSVWLLEKAVLSRFADEVATRANRDLTPGERVEIRRGDVVTSGTGREYRSFRVRFPDRPKRKALDILGGSATDEPPSEGEGQDGDIPF